MNTNGYELPVYLVKGVNTSDFIADLGPLQFGIYDAKTSYPATPTGNGSEFFLALGSMHTKDNLSKWYAGMLDPKRGENFKGNDFKAFNRSNPSRPASEQWVVGYDGSKSSATLAYKPDTIYKLQVRVYGQPANQYWGNDMFKEIDLYTGCAPDDNDCTQTCGDVYLGVKKQTRQWVKQINANPDLQFLGVKAYPVFSDYATTASSTYKYTLRLVDNGDAGALQAIQRQYPKSFNISQVSYSRGVSTYTTDYIAAQPGAYAPKSFNYPPDCGACLGSDTLVPQYDVYQVRRQLASSTDLDDDTARTNYAAQVVTDYSGVTGSGKYEGIIAGEAVVSFNKAFGVAITALNSDILKRTASTSAYCQTTTPATVAWVQGVGGYTITRTLTITVPNEDCNNAPTLAQVQAALASTKGVTSGNVTDITDNTGGGIQQDFCVKVFQVVQASNVMNDQWCMTSDTALFADVPSFMGVAWVETDTTDVYDATIHAGIRFVAPLISKKLGTVASYSPTEYYDLDPTQLEVSLLEDTIIPCQFNRLVNARRTVAPKYSRLSGYFVLSQYIKKNSAYKTYEEWANDPRGREVIDNTVLDQMKVDAYYVEYHVKYISHKPHTNFAQKGEAFDSIVYIDEADTVTQAAFEASIQGVSAKFGVYLENRGK